MVCMTALHIQVSLHNQMAKKCGFSSYMAAFGNPLYMTVCYVRNTSYDCSTLPSYAPVNNINLSSKVNDSPSSKGWQLKSRGMYMNNFDCAMEKSNEWRKKYLIDI